MGENRNTSEDSSKDSGITRRKDRPVTDNPDVHLDAPQLKIDELNLSLLGILNVEVKGLETELLLEADLQNLIGLLRRVVDALEDDESSASEMVEALGRAVRAASGGSYSGENVNGGRSVRQVLEAAKNALDSYDEGPSGQGVRHEVDANGDVTRITLDEAGEVASEEILGNVSELSERG